MKTTLLAISFATGLAAHAVAGEILRLKLDDSHTRKSLQWESFNTRNSK